MEQKSGREINKPVWIVRRKEDNKLIERFRSRCLAEKLKRKLEKRELEEYILERDNQWKYKLK